MNKLLLTGLLAFSINAHAATLKLDWVNPNIRTDGSTLFPEELSHSIIRWSCPAGSGQEIVFAPANTASIEVPYIGVCSFEVASVDITELQGAWSDTKQYLIRPGFPPTAPTWVDIVIAWAQRLFNKWIA